MVISNCIIIHGCPSSKDRAINSEGQFNMHWIPWVKSQLISKGIDTASPLMPTAWLPDYSEFKLEFEKYRISEKSVLVGHSCGCSFIVRWLGETKTKISKLILVAPWKIDEIGDKYRKQFYNYEIDKTIKKRVPIIIMYTSDNERENGKKSLEMFRNSLGGEIINLNGYGHYTMNDMGTDVFKELVQKIIQ